MGIRQIYHNHSQGCCGRQGRHFNPDLGTLLLKEMGKMMCTKGQVKGNFKWLKRVRSFVQGEAAVIE